MIQAELAHLKKRFKEKDIRGVDVVVFVKRRMTCVKLLSAWCTAKCSAMRRPSVISKPLR